MAFIPDSITQNAPASEEHPEDETAAFDMVSLREHLPRKRKGLSLYFSGKSRSFARLGDAKCIGDLEKTEPEIPEAKRRKYMDRRSAVVLDLVPWRAAAPGSSHHGACIGA